MQKSSRILAKSWGHFWPSAIGKHWDRHAHRLRYFSGESLGASGKVCGGGGDLMSISPGILASSWRVLKEMHRFIGASWPSLGGMTGRQPWGILGGRHAQLAKYLGENLCRLLAI